MNTFSPRAIMALSAILALTACATPYEQCISQAGSELHQQERQIQQTQANINRGYAVHTQSVPYTVAKECVNEDKQVYRCDEVRYHTEQTPVPIDIATETRKLSRLTKGLDALRRETQDWEHSCRAKYPEG